MKLIKLTKGLFAKVDDKNFQDLNTHKWFANCNGYAARMVDRRISFMHREVLLTPEGLYTDHINGDRLDNRRCNLRICSNRQNFLNRKLEIRNKSGYKGVCWNKQNNKWQAKIEINDKKIYLGFFLNKLEAARAYNVGAKKYFGDFARLNDL